MDEVTISSTITLRFATRDDSHVAKAIYSREEIDSIYGLDSVGLLDGLFVFMKDIGFIDALKRFNIISYKRMMLPLVNFILTYMTKILMDIPSMNALPEILFANRAAMELIGFNAEVLENGLCNRGNHSRTPGKKKPAPFSPQTLANVLERFSIEEAESLLNTLISLIARNSLLDEELSAIIDATDLEVPDSFPEIDGCGAVVRKKKVVDKHGRIQEIEVVVRGFKLITLLWQRGRIPLAAKIVKINEHESNYMLELIHKAQENIGRYAKIARLFFDKGFLDGPTLYELDEMHITFVVPAKDNMRVTCDARSIAGMGSGYISSRTIEVSHGHGDSKTTEHLTTELVGIEGLCTYDQYSPEEEQNHIGRKDYSPKPINAVVVRKWDNKDFGPSGKTVFLTNGPVDDPFVPFDGYDERSTIENLLHREGKQAFGLGVIPKRSTHALYTHVYMVLTTFAIVQAYRTYQDRGDDHDAELWPTEKALEEDDLPSPSTARKPRMQKRDDPFHGIGMARWRRQLSRANMDKVIVFFQGSYGIFDLTELGILSGMRLKVSREEREFTERILERYGIDPSP